MEKIILCNYYGMCDSSLNVVGHTNKVTREYYELLSSKYKVSLIASPCVSREMQDSSINVERQLKHNIYIDVPFTLKKRILDKVWLIKNLRDCFRSGENNNLFFYQVEFFFFFYVALFYRRRNQKVYCLIYHQDFTGGKVEKVLQWFYQRALKKIDGVIYTQIGHPPIHKNISWMPDYLYDENKYLKYEKMSKQEKVVCLGTMNRYKQLEELVKVFSVNKYPLEIVGRFDDEERYRKLKGKASVNIVIENRILSETEYYEWLGTAKYSVLPYDMSQYKNRTSGVLLESLFTGSIPIAPEELLGQNQLPGIGYGRLEELEGFCLDDKLRTWDESERQRVITQCRKEKVVKTFENIICNS